MEKEFIELQQTKREDGKLNKYHPNWIDQASGN